MSLAGGKEKKQDYYTDIMHSARGQLGGPVINAMLQKQDKSTMNVWVARFVILKINKWYDGQDRKKTIRK